MKQTIDNLVLESSKKLQNISDSPRLDVEILLSSILGISKFDLFLKGPENIDEADKLRFFDSLNRRMNHEPVAYITGEKPFFEDVFYVDRRVLIPRPETEFLVLEAVNHLKNYEKNPSVLDVCCGSGCVGLSVLRVIECELTMTDISDDSLAVARINLERLFGKKDFVKILKSDVFDNIEKKQDVITANPPYLSAADIVEFVKEEVKYEPEKALFGGDNGFEFTERILNESYRYLNPGGIVAVELGFEGATFLKDSYKNIKLKKIVKDYSGIERVAVFSLLS